MTDPHIHEERIVEPAVVEREVVRPARTRIVTEHRTGGTGYGSNPVLLVAAGAVLLFIIYMVAAYLL